MTLTAPGWPILLPQEAHLGHSCLSHPVPPGKEDGRSCKKVTIRMTIRKNDCRSSTPVRDTSMVVGAGIGKDGDAGDLGSRHSVGCLTGLSVSRST